MVKLNSDVRLLIEVNIKHIDREAKVLYTTGSLKTYLFYWKD